ncbi:MAG: phenylalanine--tRNA ligase subunit alpha [candidate division WWE3 bacterium]|nr:phenylalanine--tRNA ligase subunit alpha [candidate division WWE3 bacterium]
MPNSKEEFLKLKDQLKTANPSEKKQLGLKLNELKKSLEAFFIDSTTTSDDKSLDLDTSMPSIKPTTGHLHPITQMRKLAEDIFMNMGFQVIDSVEVDNDYNHFEALNFPVGHPARDTWDTFWTKEHLLPIAHTSTMQHRVLATHKPPFAAIIPGRCFRYEATDAVHEHTFNQIEGVYVSKNASLAELIGVLETFVYTYYGYKIPYKIQPTFFPFVEPGLEMLIEHTRKDGTKKWLELIPAGMIHPNVLQMAGLDPKVYKGFAWAIGLDRLVMLKYGISDIRDFFKGDLRFLGQF